MRFIIIIWELYEIYFEFFLIENHFIIKFKFSCGCCGFDSHMREYFHFLTLVIWLVLTINLATQHANSWKLSSVWKTQCFYTTLPLHETLRKIHNKKEKLISSVISVQDCCTPFLRWKLISVFVLDMFCLFSLSSIFLNI